MSKMHKIVLYIIETNNEEYPIDDYVDELDYLELLNAAIVANPVGTVDIGEWSDDHPLNKPGNEHLYEEYMKK